MPEESSLEEYWNDLRGKKPPKEPKKRKPSRKEIDEAIIARSKHLIKSAYYRNRNPEQTEEEELRQAVLDRAPHLDEWVIRRRRRT